MSLDISLETVPNGVRNEWLGEYSDATPSCARALLAISEAVRCLELEEVTKHLEVIPKEFYESSLDILCRNTIILKEKAQSFFSENSEPPAKISKKSNENQESSSGKTSAPGKHDSKGESRNKNKESIHSKMGTPRKHDSRTFTISAIAEKHKLAAKEGKKNPDYSGSRSFSTQVK